MNQFEYEKQAVRIYLIHNHYVENEIGNTGEVEYWHYTSIGAIRSMFKDYIDNAFDREYVDYCEMWATNVRYMNDPEEYKSGIDFITDSANKGTQKDICGKANEKYSIISYSSVGDNLEHWKWYGKESGVSIQFDMNHIMTSVFKEKNDATKYNNNVKPIPVFYHENDKKDYFEYLGQIIENGDMHEEDLNTIFVPFCKDENYEKEKEYRMVFFDVDSECDYVYNTSDSKLLKPAINVKMKYRNGTKSAKLLNGIIRDSNTTKANDNIIREMIVGPGVNQEIVFNGLIHMFDRQNYRYYEFGDIDKQVVKAKSELGACEISWVEDGDGRRRIAYKCKNGIIIMKSAVAFRG